MVRTMRPVHNVLVVEDSFMLLEIIAQLCASQGTRVIEASSGEAALTILRERGATIDWLFTDINLPGLIDGWTVAEAFRAAHPDRPVVYTSTAAKLPPRTVPGSLYLRKPFQIREVNALVRMMREGVSDDGLRAAG